MHAVPSTRDEGDPDLAGEPVESVPDIRSAVAPYVQGLSLSVSLS